MVLTREQARTVIWHDLECGGYRADLPLWRELAQEATRGRGARVLDIGAGTGRVALDLAEQGHRVTALDRDEGLLATLRERVDGRSVETVHADAREFALDSGDFDLCLVPMQTLQLLSGAEQREALFAHARAHLRGGALFAAAIVGEVDEFDSREGKLGPSPERVQIDRTLYVSRAIRVSKGERAILIERERMVTEPGALPGASELDRIELESLDAREIWEEMSAAGLDPQPSRFIAETREHSGSEVLIGRA